MSEREQLEVDVAIVGGGPAGLAAAIHLVRQAREKGNEPPEIAVIEKAPEFGAQSLSGAVMDPRGLDKLIPDWRDRVDFPFAPVEDEAMLLMTGGSKFKLPYLPPSMRHHGAFVVSIQRLVAWLGHEAEKLEINLFPGFSANSLLRDGGKVIGVRTGDRGLDKSGDTKGNFEAGYDILAKVTLLAEGVRGTLSQQLVREHDLDEGKNPALYAGGAKEIWRVPEGRVKPGRVWHTLGWPLKSDTFGGAFIYEMPDNLISLGMVVGLDSPDPQLSVHAKLQELKTHPWVKQLLDGGEVVSYGAKAIPEGGYWAIPKLAVDGALLLGDSAGLVNAMRLKGIHLAMESGMAAADVVLDALAENDVSAARLMSYDRNLRDGEIGQELYGVRNFRQAYQSGLFAGMFHTGLQLVTGGRGLRERYAAQEDHHRTKTLAAYGSNGQVEPEYDGKYLMNKMSDLYFSATRHEENQPPHLVVLDPNLCSDRCRTEYGNPCEKFCPAGVYEMVADGDGKKLHLNFSNCVHCKICDIADPYGVIVWTTPEGGDGPRYKQT